MVTLPASGPLPWRSAVAELETEYALKTVAAWEMQALGVHCILFDSLSSEPLHHVLRDLQGDRRIEIAQLNQLFELRGSVAARDDTVAAETGYNDPYAGLQYSLEILDLEHAHRWSTGQGVEIAIVDTGIDVTHPDLRASVSGARNLVRQDADRFTGDFHGTAVAGVIAAAADNGDGIVGVAPAAKIEAIKACWQPSQQSRRAVCSSYTLALALDYSVARGFDIINLSLGGPSDPLLEQLILAALARGTVVVAASSRSAIGQVAFPASVPGVLAVTACDASGRLWGDMPETHAVGLVAPGAEILSLAPQGTYDFSSGDSLAAAHASGLAALLLQRQPHLTGATIEEILATTSTPPAEEGAAAVVDACKALAKLLDTSGCSSD